MCSITCDKYHFSIKKVLPKKYQNIFLKLILLIKLPLNQNLIMICYKFNNNFNSQVNFRDEKRITLI